MVAGTSLRPRVSPPACKRPQTTDVPQAPSPRGWTATCMPGRAAVIVPTFLDQIAGKAELVEAGYSAGRAQADPRLDPAGLLFAGMGGSGAAAMLVRDAAARTMERPFTITQHHAVPRHV